MGDMISREDVIEEYIVNFGLTIEDIERIPAVDAEPVKHGRWIRRKTVTHHGELYCSICEEESPIQMLWRYCPSCGAKMDLTE